MPRTNITNSRLTTTKEELLKAVGDSLCDVIFTGEPTYWSTVLKKVPGLIDFFTYKNISRNFLHIKETDHSVIILILCEDIIQYHKPLKVTKIIEIGLTIRKKIK